MRPLTCGDQTRRRRQRRQLQRASHLYSRPMRAWPRRLLLRRRLERVFRRPCCKLLAGAGGGAGGGASGSDVGEFFTKETSSGTKEKLASKRLLQGS